MRGSLPQQHPILLAPQTYRGITRDLYSVRDRYNSAQQFER